MASQTALIIDAGTQKRIPNTDTLLVGVGINPSAAGALSIGIATATSIVIGAGGITTSFPGPVALTGGISTVGGTTFATSATFQGDVTFGTDGGADGPDTATFIATIASDLAFDGPVGATGTATSGGASTLTDSGAAFGVNAFAGNVIRITAGTGIGQSRVIASNTATVVTNTTAWAVNPDATSVYDILTESFKVRNIADPTLPQDVATKAYVDAAGTTPGGTDGSVQYNNGGLFGGVAAQLFFDDGTNRLGVGTATPNEKLTVSGVISIGEGAAPTATAAFGKLWANSAFDARPYFQNDLGQSFNLTLDRFNTLTTGGAITIDTDPILPIYNSVTLNAAATFSTTNLGVGRSASIRVVCDGTTRALTFPGTWTWMGTSPPASLAANDVGWLSIIAFGATDADVVAAWIFENAPAVVTGSGVAQQVAFWSSSSAIAGDAQLTYNSGTDTLTLTGSFTLTTGTVSMTAGAASTLATTAGDITIDAQAASVIIDGGETAADAVRIVASAAAGGIDVDAGTAGITIDSTGAISIDGVGASNVSATSGNLTISTITSGDVILATPSAASALVVKVTTGRVGIGNSAPTQLLSVGAASEFAVSSGGKIKNYNGAAPLDGQLLIGNTAGVSFDAATITAGTGISVTNGAGSITIAVTASPDIDIVSIAQQTVLTGDLVRFVDNAGTPNVQKTDSNDTARQGPVGFVVTGVAAAASVTVRVAGEASVPAALFDAAPAVGDVGKRVFMSTTPGQVTLTAPTNPSDVVQRVGILTNGSGSPKILVQVGEPITL